MTPWRWLLLAVFTIGLLMGPSSLSSVNASQPPIQWIDVPLVFVAFAFGMLFVLGIQLFRRDPRHARFGYRTLTVGAVFFAANGVSSSALAAFHAEVTPASLFLLAFGGGALIGLGLFRIAFRRRFGVAL